MSSPKVAARLAYDQRSTPRRQPAGRRVGELPCRHRECHSHAQAAQHPRAPREAARRHEHRATGAKLGAVPARFMTLDEVRDVLAITDSMAYTLVRTGELPAVQVGPKRVWRVEATKLEEYIERQNEVTRKRIADGKA